MSLSIVYRKLIDHRGAFKGSALGNVLDSFGLTLCSPSALSFVVNELFRKFCSVSAFPRRIHQRQCEMRGRVLTEPAVTSSTTFSNRTFSGAPSLHLVSESPHGCSRRASPLG